MATDDPIKVSGKRPTSHSPHFHFFNSKCFFYVGLENVAEISAGHSHVLALLSTIQFLFLISFLKTN